MKKGILILMAFISLSACQNQGKIAFVDNGKLINEYQKKKDVEAVFQTKVNVFNKEADSVSNAFQLEVQEFQTNANSLSEKQQQEQYQALGQKKQFQDYQLQLKEQEIQQEGQAQIDSLIKEIRDYVKSYGKTKNYSFILGSNEAGSVMYGAEANDLTAEILKELNDSYSKK